MKNLQLSDFEARILTSLLSGEIKRVEKEAGDPFYTADIVNIFRKLEDQSVEVKQEMVPLVIHGAPEDTTTPKELPEAQAPKVDNKKKVNSKVKVTVDNIDAMTDALIPQDSVEELKIEKPKVK